jgi:hypothetical protein
MMRLIRKWHPWQMSHLSGLTVLIVATVAGAMKLQSPQRMSVEVRVVWVSHQSSSFGGMLLKRGMVMRTSRVVRAHSLLLTIHAPSMRIDHRLAGISHTCMNAKYAPAA